MYVTAPEHGRHVEFAAGGQPERVVFKYLLVLLSAYEERAAFREITNALLIARGSGAESAQRVGRDRKHPSRKRVYVNREYPEAAFLFLVAHNGVPVSIQEGYAAVVGARDIFAGKPLLLKKRGILCNGAGGRHTECRKQYCKSFSHPFIQW